VLDPVDPAHNRFWGSRVRGRVDDGIPSAGNAFGNAYITEGGHAESRGATNAPRQSVSKNKKAAVALGSRDWGLQQPALILILRAVKTAPPPLGTHALFGNRRRGLAGPPPATTAAGPWKNHSSSGDNIFHSSGGRPARRPKTIHQALATNQRRPSGAPRCGHHRATGCV